MVRFAKFKRGSKIRYVDTRSGDLQTERGEITCVLPKKRYIIKTPCGSENIKEEDIVAVLQDSPWTQRLAINPY